MKGFLLVKHKSNDDDNRKNLELWKTKFFGKFSKFLYRATFKPSNTQSRWLKLSKTFPKRDLRILKKHFAVVHAIIMRCWWCLKCWGRKSFSNNTPESVEDEENSEKKMQKGERVFPFTLFFLFLAKLICMGKFLHFAVLPSSVKSLDQHQPTTTTCLTISRREHERQFAIHECR